MRCDVTCDTSRLINFQNFETGLHNRTNLEDDVTPPVHVTHHGDVSVLDAVRPDHVFSLHRDVAFGWLGHCLAVYSDRYGANFNLKCVVSTRVK